MKAMEPTRLAPPQQTWHLEGTYSEKDLRAFAAFLAGRVASSKVWALGLFVLMPLLWSGNLRTSWPWMVPIAVVLIGFILLLRFVILPNKLYRAAIQLPGVFDTRRILVDASEVQNTSGAGEHRFRLEDVQAVVIAPEHLFILVTDKQGFPIPLAWVGDAERVSRLRERLLSRSHELS